MLRNAFCVVVMRVEGCEVVVMAREMGLVSEEENKSRRFR